MSSKSKRSSSLFKRNSLRLFGSVFSDSSAPATTGNSTLAPIPQHSSSSLKPASSSASSSKLSRKSSIASRLSGSSNNDTKTQASASKPSHHLFHGNHQQQEPATAGENNNIPDPSLVQRQGHHHGSTVSGSDLPRHNPAVLTGISELPGSHDNNSFQFVSDHDTNNNELQQIPGPFSPPNSAGTANNAHSSGNVNNTQQLSAPYSTYSHTNSFLSATAGTAGTAITSTTITSTTSATSNNSGHDQQGAKQRNRASISSRSSVRRKPPPATDDIDQIKNYYQSKLSLRTMSPAFGSSNNSHSIFEEPQEATPGSPQVSNCQTNHINNSTDGPSLINSDVTSLNNSGDFLASTTTNKGHTRTKSEIEELQDQVNELLRDSKSKALPKLDTDLMRNDSVMSNTTQPASSIYDSAVQSSFSDTQPLTFRNNNNSNNNNSNDNNNNNNNNNNNEAANDLDFDFTASQHGDVSHDSMSNAPADDSLSPRDSNEKFRSNSVYGTSLYPVNSHQSFIEHARRSNEHLDELITENHEKLKAEHGYIDQQLLLLSPKNRGTEEHEELKRKSFLFAQKETEKLLSSEAQPYPNDDLHSTSAKEKEHCDSSIPDPARHETLPYPKDSNLVFNHPLINASYLSSSIHVHDEFIDALEQPSGTRDTHIIAPVMPGGFVGGCATELSKPQPMQEEHRKPTAPQERYGNTNEHSNHLIVDDFNFNPLQMLSPPSPSMSRSRGESASQYSNTDTFNAASFDGDTIQHDLAGPVNQHSSSHNDNASSVEELNAIADYRPEPPQYQSNIQAPKVPEASENYDIFQAPPLRSEPLLNHVPTLKSVTDSTVSTGGGYEGDGDYDYDDELNFTARSQVYSPYGLEDTVKPRKMVVANNVTDDEADDDETDSNITNNQIHNNGIQSPISNDFNNYQVNHGIQHPQHTGSESIPDYSSGSLAGPFSGHSFSSPGTDWGIFSNTHTTPPKFSIDRSSAYNYRKRDPAVPPEVRGGKAGSDFANRMSNPHLPPSVYDPVDKINRLSPANVTIPDQANSNNSLNNQIQVTQNINTKAKKYEGCGQKCSYVEVIRQRTLCANTATGTRNWRLPIGIKPVDQKSIQRKSSGLSSSIKNRSRFGYTKGIKHVSLQPRLLAQGDDEDDAAAAGDGTIITQKQQSVKKQSIEGLRSDHKGTAGDEFGAAGNHSSDDEDLFAEFADDINEVKAANAAANAHNSALGNSGSLNNGIPGSHPLGATVTGSSSGGNAGADTTSNDGKFDSHGTFSDNDSGSSVNMNFYDHGSNVGPMSPTMTRFETFMSSGTGSAAGNGGGGGLFIANPDTDSD